MTQRNDKISLHLLGVSSPQELVRDLQDTHTHTQNGKQLLFNTIVDTQVHLGTSVLHRGRIIVSQTAKNCLYVSTSYSPVTSLLQKGQSLDFLCLLHSLLQSFDPFLSASTCVFTSVPVQRDTPSRKPPHIQSDSPTSTSHLNDWWSFNCSWRPNSDIHGRSLIKTVLG